MKYNIAEVALLQPDYLGFIFYEKSRRNFDLEIPPLNPKIKKVGVFVDATLDFVYNRIHRFDLDVIQLHGDESPNYCITLRKRCRENFSEGNKEIWKVFALGESFDFSLLTPYETIVDKYLFDTKGASKGGTGEKFDWNILDNYASNKPFVLSGGIGLSNLSEIQKLTTSSLPIHAIDVNSRFEYKPGLKNCDDLKICFDEL